METCLLAQDEKGRGWEDLEGTASEVRALEVRAGLKDWKEQVFENCFTCAVNFIV